jgi:beta-galactosidase
VVDRDGRRLGPGSRGITCPSSPAYAEATARITSALAERYAGHPAVVMWHVHNEYGAPVFECHCDQSQVAFREWLLARYGDLEQLNSAWGTTFWGQIYGDIDEVRTPAATASVANPAHQLDYHRFCDEELRRCFRRERDIIAAYSDRPVTTNFMATSCPATDLWRWRDEVDIVANDHYLTAERADRHILLAMDADLTRSLAGGRPWLLMEHSTSAVNWQPRNIAKLPGEMTRNSLTHIARGADGALFFQWRASRSGAEKFHSAMLPHGGTEREQWREVVDLGALVGSLGDLRGTTVQADVAILWDWESFWAQDLEWRPSADLDHRERTVAFYTRLWRDNITVDFAHPSADLSRYRLVVVPQMYLVDEQSAQNLRQYVDNGGNLLVSYFSGAVDRNDAVHPQGLAGPLGDVLGIDVTEFAPLNAGETVRLSLLGQELTADVWTDRLAVTGSDTDVVARFDDGPAAGGPAITRRRLGAGQAWYLATRLDVDALAAVLNPLYDVAGLTRTETPEDLEVITRSGAVGRFRVLINHASRPVPVPAAGSVDAVSGNPVVEGTTVPAGGVLVLREEDDAEHER